jgi:hypothetical protein
VTTFVQRNGIHLAYGFIASYTLTATPNHGLPGAAVSLHGAPKPNTTPCDPGDAVTINGSYTTTSGGSGTTTATGTIAADNTFTIPTTIPLDAVGFVHYQGSISCGAPINSTVLTDSTDVAVDDNATLTTPLDFGTVQVGTTSAEKTATLTNGNGTLVISSITISGANAGDFTIVSGTGVNDCRTGVTNALPPNGTCQIRVTFKPAATGNRSATLTVADNANNTPQTAQLLGTGAAPGLPSTGAPAVAHPVAPAGIPLGIVALLLAGLFGIAVRSGLRPRS